ncbi:MULTISPECIES: hypothetical protein [unclassified Schlesneria]|uniref:hypothetical protein n=1 Tax=unclassified Schlesneria TaxID=2762017 RepID=UPI002F0D507F
MTNTTETARNTELREANSCMTLGAGLGAVGTGTALVAGVTCPLCVVIGPALFGFGVWKRIAVLRGACGESVNHPSAPVESETVSQTKNA